MIETSPSVEERLRRLRADLIIKTGDLKVTARKLRRAQDDERIRRATMLKEELDKIKSTIEDVKKTIAELGGEEGQDEFSVAG